MLRLLCTGLTLVLVAGCTNHGNMLECNDGSGWRQIGETGNQVMGNKYIMSDGSLYLQKSGEFCRDTPINE